MKSNFFKRLLSLFVVIVMVVTMLPTVFAVSSEPDSTVWTDVSTTEELTAAMGNAEVSNIRLTDDIKIAAEYKVSRALTLDLNGYTVSSTAAHRCLNITADVTVQLQNGTVEMPGGNSNGSIFYVQKGKLILEGMTVLKSNFTEKNTTQNNGGIAYATGDLEVNNSVLKWVDSTGNMYRGGTIYIDASDVTINNSELNGGRAYQWGGNVHVNSGGTLDVTNSLITGGTVTTTSGTNGGGNVYVAYKGSVFTMNSGAVVNGSTTRYGGNVMVGAGGTFNMYGGYIGSGKANLGGENVWVRGSTATDYATAAHIYGGTIGNGNNANYVDIANQTLANSVSVLKIYNAYTCQDPTEFKAGCAAETVEANTVVDAAGNKLYMVAHANGACATCNHTYANANAHVHSYVASGDAYTCACGDTAEAAAKSARCEVCDEIVEWMPWVGGNFIDAGHYYLTGDVQLAGTVLADKKVCLDLNDYTITAAAGSRAFYLTAEGEMSICDLGANAEDKGTIVGKTFYAGHGATIYCNSGVLNLNGVVITDGHAFGSANSAGNIYTGNKFNAQNSAILNGVAGNYAGNIYISGTANTDGTDDVVCINTTISGGVSGNMGGNMYISGANTTAAFTSCAIGDGEATNGGNICLNSAAQATMADCTITGGTATTSYGDSIYVRGNNTSMGTVSELTLDNGTTVGAGKTAITDIRVVSPALIHVKSGVTTAENPKDFMECAAVAFNGETYKTFGGQTALTEAQAYATADGSVTLGEDVTVDDDLTLSVAELNLNGKKLTVGGTLDATLTDLVDNTGNASIEAEDVMAEGTKSALPLTDAEGKTTLVKPTSTKKGSKNNTTAGDTKVFAFYLGDVAGEEVHTAILAGDVELAVMLKNGDVTVGTYNISESTMAAYAADWQNMAIKLTVTDAADMDLSFEVVCISNQAEYVTAETPVAE